MQELFGNLGINGKLLVSQAVTFLLVFFLLKKFVFKKVLAFLEERKQHIEKGVALTQKAQTELARINEARKREIESAKKQGETFMQEAKTAAQEKTKEILLSAKTAQEKLLKKAKEEAEKEKEEAVLRSQEEIRNRALLLAEKILQRTLTKKDEERLTKEVMHQIQTQAYAK